jgi:hypothetical protein
VDSVRFPGRRKDRLPNLLFRNESRANGGTDPPCAKYGHEIITTRGTPRFKLIFEGTPRQFGKKQVNIYSTTKH